MCLILVAWRSAAEFPCVIAANRDEFHARAAQPAHWWPSDPPLLAGQDLQAGGTWLGMTPTGRFAALTNFRDPEQRRPGMPSRGTLVTSILQSGADIAQTLRHLHSVGRDYNGFNLLFSDGQRLAIYESMSGAGRELGPGIYGLSNHLLDTPWPKVQAAKSRLSAALADLPDTKSALALLRDDELAPDEHLPITGMAVEWERLLSSAFIRSPSYGTRCSTVIRIDRARRVGFEEWTWDSTGRETARVSFEFELELELR
jgi:uncharacterized protein with NRDE domain